MPPNTPIKLYRAVNEAEFQDLIATHQFRAGPNSLGGKFFAEFDQLMDITFREVKP